MAPRMDVVALRFSDHGTKEMLGVVDSNFDQFRTLHNNSQQHTTICNRVCKRTQHATSNDAGSCWPVTLHPFVWGLKNILTHILPFLLQFFLVIRRYRSFYSSFSLFRFGYLEKINIKALKGEFCFL